MNLDPRSRRKRAPSFGGVLFGLLVLSVTATSACSAPPEEEDVRMTESHLDVSSRMARYGRIRAAAAERGLKSGYLLAGIAFDETGIAQCWSEATWACQGPSSPDCNGGPVIAGSADGPCSDHQGGLGMFQFDAGNFNDTLRVYGNDVLTIDGQVRHAVDYVVRMVRDSVYTTNAETNEKALVWLNEFDVNNATLRDQWIRTVVRYYNGCGPGCSVWNARYATYSDGLNQVLADTHGRAFWDAGTSCPASPYVVIGAIDAKYRALGGCTSFLGHPITNELTTPDGVGRYSVFENGSIYWSPSSLTGTSLAIGAHEVHGKIRDTYRDRGWEAGPLGYPISDELEVTGGRESHFEHGTISFDAATGETTVTLVP